MGTLTPAGIQQLGPYLWGLCGDWAPLLGLGRLSGGLPLRWVAQDFLREAVSGTGTTNALGFWSNRMLWRDMLSFLLLHDAPSSLASAGLFLH
jgi:hypothetical protein